MRRCWVGTLTAVWLDLIDVGGFASNHHQVRVGPANNAQSHRPSLENEVPMCYNRVASQAYPVCPVDPAAAASCWAAGGRSSTLTTAQRALKRKCAATTPRTNSCPRLSLVSCPPATGVALQLASYGGRAELPVTRTHVLGLRTRTGHKQVRPRTTEGL